MKIVQQYYISNTESSIYTCVLYFDFKPDLMLSNTPSKPKTSELEREESSKISSKYFW